MDVILARVSEVEGDVFVRRQRSEDAASVQDRLRKRSSKSATNNVVKESRDAMNAERRENAFVALHEEIDRPVAYIERGKVGEEIIANEEALGLDAVVLGMKIEEVENAREEIKRRLKQKQEKVIETNKVVVKDNVRFHELGYKDRYYGDSYKRKDLAVGGGLDRMCETYVQGLCWVLQYYYQGW